MQIQEPLSEKYIYQLGLWIDDYQDIFSDFDPRPYSKRQISDDFIIELRKRVKENPKGEYEIAFYLPKEKRDQKTENIIKKRIREYFEFELKNLKEKIRKKDNDLGRYFIAGIFVLFLSTFLNMEYPQDRAVLIFANLILPAGWFSIWGALDYFLNQKKSEKEKLTFFEKMKKCSYRFEDFEIVKEQFGESKQKVVFFQKETENQIK